MSRSGGAASSQIGAALRARPSAAHRVQISRFREQLELARRSASFRRPSEKRCPLHRHWVRNPVWWSRKDRGGCRAMGEDRPLRHCVLQHHVNLRCDSAGCPPPAHLTRSTMTPSATPTGCLRGSSIAVLPCRSGKRCSYRARPGSGLPAGRHRHGSLSPGRSGHANLAGQDHGKPAAGIRPRQAHLPPDCAWERAGRAVRAACIASRHRRDPVLEL